MTRIREFFEIRKGELEEEKNPLDLAKILSVSIIGVAFVYLATFLIFIVWKAPLSPGEMGDTFGMANSLFSALAFAFLIYTSLLQTEELRLQRQELKDNREELKRSADAQDKIYFLQTQVYREKIFPRLIPDSMTKSIKYIDEWKTSTYEVERSTRTMRFKIVNEPIKVIDFKDSFDDLDQSSKTVYILDRYGVFAFISNKKLIDPDESFNIEFTTNSDKKLDDIIFSVRYESIDKRRFIQRFKVNNKEVFPISSVIPEIIE